MSFHIYIYEPIKLLILQNTINLID